jgi:3-oxoacyl-[acyl-carrier protein] reductase
MKKAAIIFGATGGIGSELVAQLDPKEWTIFGIARDRERLEALAKSHGCRVHSADITQSDQVRQLASSNLFAPPADQKWDHMGLVVSVGSILLKPAHLTSDEEFEETLKKNLYSAFYVIREFTKNRISESLSIILFSSVAARVGLRNHEAIAAAKAGVIGLAQSAAASYAKQGVRVNVIAPGLVKTPLSARLTQNEASLKASEAMHPLGRIGEPRDIASLAAWLIQPEQSWLSGEVFGVDGGMAKLKV